MHSSQFTRLAQAADMNAWTISAMVELPADGSTYPAAICVIEREFAPFADMRYGVSMGVLPTDDEAFFTNSTYDVTLGTALKMMTARAASKLGVTA